MYADTIAKQLFYTTSRVETSDASGNKGCGTAFIFNYIKDNLEYPFVVTNKHVVQCMSTGSLTFIISDGSLPRLGDGYSKRIDSWPSAWYGHPDPKVDIAVTPFNPIMQQIKQEAGLDLFFRVIPSSHIPTPEQTAALDAIEPISFIGYPNGTWDSKNLLPIARRGTTASPYQIDFENEPTFLIDASVFPGSSGSPVFVYDRGTFRESDGSVKVGTRVFFIGVVAKVCFRTQLNELIYASIPTANYQFVKQQEFIDLGVVYKARTVVETIEHFLAEKA